MKGAVNRMRSPAPFYGSFLTKRPTLPERSLMFPAADGRLTRPFNSGFSARQGASDTA